MAVLKKGNYKAPFLGKSNDYSTGRDALGLQTTSQASYSTLLPGLTNLTNRIRYYGFYSWLLEIYAKEIGDTNPKIQNRFMRRGEYMIALIMQLHEKETTQIPGSLFAANELKNKETEPTFDLKFGADIEKGKSTYWKYSSGAFGQYYSGAMQAIGLIIHRDNSPVFACTEHEDNSIVTGTLLANAFDENISSEVKSLVVSSIEKGILKKSDSEKLHKELSITLIQKNTNEWKLYTKMLLSNDHPLFQTEDNETFFRKDSLTSILSYINQTETTKNWDFFTCDLYSRRGLDFNSIESKSSYGWYYYQLNEYWHFGVETLFWTVLETLSSKYFHVTLSDFLTDFQKVLKNSVIDYELAVTENQKLVEIIDNLDDFDSWDISEEIRECIKAKDIPKTIFLGFKMLFSIYKQNHNEFDKLKSFSAYNRMIRDGDCINGLKEFEIGINETIENVLNKFLLKNIINRHLEVAFRKMGSGVKNTLKFSYEDNFLKHIETVNPVWTTPRIYALYSFFGDLGYVDDKGNISEIGKQIIQV
jgi:hypothetical protein